MSQSSSSNAALGGPAPVASSAGRLSDFPDWLGPMLVKDLRQSLRSRSFVVVFILLQGFICLTLLMSMAATGMDAGFGFYWSVVWAVLLIAVPLRGLGAVSQERQAAMLELITLTKLNAWRLVAGKWAALSALTLLVFVCLVPCVMLRYFAVGASVADEIIMLTLLTVAGLAANALTVSASCFPERWARGLLLLGFVFLGLWSMGFSLAGMAMAGSGVNLTSVLAQAEFWVSLAMAPVAILFFLSYGAGLICDPAENHSSPRRIGLLAVILALIGLRFGFDLAEEVIITLVVFLFGIAVADAATDAPRVLVRVARPFARRGAVGVLAARFFAPGWHTSGWYVLLLAPIVSLLIIPVTGLAEVNYLGFCVVLVVGAGTVLWGTVVDRLMYRNEPPSFPRIVMIQAVAWIMAALIITFEEGIARDQLSVSALFPHAMFINLFRLANSYSSVGGVFGLLDELVVLIGLGHFVIASLVLYAISKPIREAWSVAMAQAASVPAVNRPELVKEDGAEG